MKKRIPLLSTISVVAVLIIGAIVYINMNSNNNTVGIQYVPDRPEAWNENLSGDNASGGIKIPGFGRLYFPSDTDKVQMTLANPNDNECYFIYSIHLDEPDGELLYTSDKVYPGMAIYELTLYRALAVGEYELYIHIAPYNAKSDKQLNAALLKAPLTVTNS